MPNKMPQTEKLMLIAEKTKPMTVISKCLVGNYDLLGYSTIDYTELLLNDITIYQTNRAC